ncbi:MAG: DUF3298 domain-containing protein [Mycobacterium sp.]|nr:DUF3298 domain-containing protein [Mycobacterium sp.]
MRLVNAARTLMVGLAAALSGALVACGGSAAGPSTSASSEATTTSTSAAASTSSAAAANTGVSNGQTYTVTRSTTGDATPDGTGRWTLVVDTISGGDAKVADTFNRAVRASAQGQLDPVKRDAGNDGTWSFDTKPEIFFGSAAVSELISGLYNHVPSAHPVNYVSTVVIDSRSATPITLKDLFSDEQAGLNRLSQQTKQLLPAVMGVGESPMPDAPGNAPIEANFANWIPTPSGLEIHFADYQFAHGLPVLTVPWSALDDLLAPGMAALRQP